ncbi:MAG: glutathione peroxidase [Kiritimatiellia bacterium]|jgi:glutathione peroxidase
MGNIDYGTRVTTIEGDEIDLSAYQGKVLLIVNTASKCGFTPQYDGMESMYKARKDQGLEILGFPCNQFGMQEPGGSEDIESFCKLNYGVSFQMFEKVDVNGADEHELFTQLKAGAPGVLGSRAIKWNFTKFLVGRDGEILRRWGSRVTPKAIDGELAEFLGE